MLKRSGDESRMGDVSEILMQNPPLGTQLDFDNPLNKDIVMHLAMNEGHGDVVRDLSMNGNHGTLKNMAFPSSVASGWNPGRTGVGLNFDGTNDYVDCGNDASLEIPEGTCGFWVKNSLTGNKRTVISKDAPGFNDDLTIAFEIADTLKWHFDSGAAQYIVISNTALIIGRWYYVVVVWGSAGMEMYIDGVSQADTDAFTGGIISSGTSLRIGQHQDVNFLHGAIDQVRIHNRALTAKEIMDYYINPWQVYEQ